MAAIDATASPQNLTKISRTIRRGCGVGRRITGVRLAANTERTGALKTATAHLHARARRLLTDHRGLLRAVGPV